MESPNEMKSVQPMSTVITSWRFDKPLETVWKVVKDSSSLNNILSTIKPDFASEPVLLNCSSTYEKNASFFFYVNKQYKLLYKVKEVIETDYFCQITCKMYSSLNKKQAMMKSLYLHALGTEKTLLIYERNWLIPKENEEKLKENERNETIAFLGYIEHFLDSSSQLKTQCEGRKFNVDATTLIKVLFDFGRKSFMTSFGFNCSQYPLRTGTSIGLVMKNKNYPHRYFKMKFEIEYIHHSSRGLSAKVNVYEVEEPETKQTEEAKASLPSRFIINEIVIINHHETYYSLRHHFYHTVDKSTMDFVSESKQTLLKRLSNELDKLPSLPRNPVK